MSESKIENLLRGIGNLVRDIRVKESMTQKDLAQMCGLSQTAVSRIELGKNDSLTNVYQICKAMGIEIELKFFEIKGDSDEEDELGSTVGIQETSCIGDLEAVDRDTGV